jgi:hypothetical protein
LDEEEYKARVNKLVDAIDERTKGKNLTLVKQPPESWVPSERHAWCVGFQEGQITIANAVRTLLAEFVRNTEG